MVLPALSWLPPPLQAARLALLGKRGAPTCVPPPSTLVPPRRLGSLGASVLSSRGEGGSGCLKTCFAAGGEAGDCGSGRAGRGAPEGGESGRRRLGSANDNQIGRSAEASLAAFLQLGWGSEWAPRLLGEARGGWDGRRGREEGTTLAPSCLPSRQGRQTAKRRLGLEPRRSYPQERGSSVQAGGGTAQTPWRKVRKADGRGRGGNRDSPSLHIAPPRTLLHICLGRNLRKRPDGLLERRAGSGPPCEGNSRAHERALACLGCSSASKGIRRRLAAAASPLPPPPKSEQGSALGCPLLRSRGRSRHLHMHRGNGAIWPADNKGVAFVFRALPGFLSPPRRGGPGAVASLRARSPPLGPTAAAQVAVGPLRRTPLPLRCCFH